MVPSLFLESGMGAMQNDKPQLWRPKDARKRVLRESLTNQVRQQQRELAKAGKQGRTVQLPRFNAWVRSNPATRGLLIGLSI